MGKFKLSEIKALARQGNIIIESEASRRALADFGWTKTEICAAIARLKVSDCYNQVQHTDNAEWIMLFFRADNLYQEKNVFFHFHVQDGYLVISSCHDRHNATSKK